MKRTTTPIRQANGRPGSASPSPRVAPSPTPPSSLDRDGGSRRSSYSESVTPRRFSRDGVPPPPFAAMPASSPADTPRVSSRASAPAAEAEFAAGKQWAGIFMHSVCKRLCAYDRPPPRRLISQVEGWSSRGTVLKTLVWSFANEQIMLALNAVVEQNDFSFDHVLGPESTQAEVYTAAAKPIVEDVLLGYNGTIMCYGQTGAGKTYTLASAYSAQVGIIPRATAEIFVAAKADWEYDFRVMMSYVQIYMEMLQDLLRPESSNLSIREGETGVYVAGAEEVFVQSVEDCLRLLQLGERNRTFANTKLNAHSSRSHAIVVLTVEKRLKQGLQTRRAPKSSPATAAKQMVIVGKLFLVDLAGSERLKKSGSEGQRASEAKSINLSLTCLGKCINARADPNASHVPFRDSKLTRLLQESLGGNAKTSLIVNVGPCQMHAEESLNSLQFGQRAMKVKTKAIVNEVVDLQELSDSLQEQLDMHNDKLHSLEAVVLTREEELSLTKQRLQLHEQEKEAMQRAFKSERDSHHQELSALTAQWADRLSAVEAKHEERLQQEAAAHKQKHKVFVAEIESLSKQRLNLAEQLGIAQAEVLALSKHRNVLSERVGQSMAEASVLTTERESLSHSLKSSREEFAALSEQCRQLSERVKQSTAEAAALMTERDSLSHSLKASREESAALSEQCGQLSERVKQVTAEAAELTTERESLSYSLKSSREESAALSESCRQLSEHVKQFTAEAAARTTERDCLIQLLQATREESAGLSEQCLLLKQQLVEAAISAAALEKQRDDLLANCQELNVQLAAAREESSKWHQQYLVAEGQAKELSKLRDGLQDELAATTASRDTVAASLDTANNEIAAQKQQLMEMQQRIASYETAIQLHSEDATRTAAALVIQRSQRQRNHQRLQQELSTSKKDFASKQSELASLQQELLNSRQSNASMQKDLHAVTEEKKNLEELLVKAGRKAASASLTHISAATAAFATLSLKKSKKKVTHGPDVLLYSVT
eukprot:jgi/Chlat1/4793/Chrsp31S04781